MTNYAVGFLAALGDLVTAQTGGRASLKYATNPGLRGRLYKSLMGVL